MNTQNTKVNTILFRRELAKLNIKSADTRWMIELFNMGKGYRNTKVYGCFFAAYILSGLILIAFGFLSGGGIVGLSGFAFLIVKWFPEFGKEFNAKQTFNAIIWNLEQAEAIFIDRFPGFVEVKENCRGLSEAGVEHQAMLDWTRKEIILMARKVKAGDELLRVELKIKFAAAIIMFGKSFDRGQSYDLFFTEKITSEMHYFKEELGLPSDSIE